jgi:hypothetical protein
MIDKRYIQPRNLGIVLTFLLLFLFANMTHLSPASAGKKKSTVTSELSSQKFLKGAMQGMSSVVLDLNGDNINDFVVGAPFANHSGANGALLIYFADKNGFYKKPAVILDGDGNLGWSLVSLGDLNDDDREDFAVGAYSGSGKYSSLAGTVIIYHGGKKPNKISVLEGEHALDKFGYSIASGDLNHDGYLDLVVGAPFHSPTPLLYQQGALYIYFGPDYDPEDAIKIPASAIHTGIGFSVATGDITDDGIDDLLIGASGRVVVYCGAKDIFPACPNPDFVYKDIGYNPYNGFGRNMAVLGDVNGDDYNDIVIGAHQETVSGEIDSGRLFILKGGPKTNSINNCTSDVSSLELLYLINGEPNCGQFGSAILPVGDSDGDDVPDVVVSAVHADGNPWLMTGKIYLISGAELGQEISVAKKIEGKAKNMHLGASLALIGDGKTIAAGAPTENGNTGVVHLYDLSMFQR